MLKHAPIAPYMDDFEDAAASLPGADNPRLAEMRRAAAASYRQQGLPHRKIEAWHYTRLKDLEEGGFVRAAKHSALEIDLPDAGLSGPVERIVIVDGHFVPELSSALTVAGVSVRSLETCLLENDQTVIDALDRHAPEEGLPLASLATAFLHGGVVIQVADGVKVAPVLELVSVTTSSDTPKLSFPRVLLQIGKDAAATVVGTFSGHGAYAVNAVTDIDLGEGAVLNHYVLQEQSPEATHVYLGRCDVPASAKYEGFILQLGAKVARHEMHLRMVGKDGLAVLNGAYGVRGSGHCDTTTVIDHIAAETNTDQVFKGILDGTSRGVYQGRVHVHRDAQRINGNQLHNAMLLSRKAHANCKPELEIYADDVKCSHGATVGELDPAQIFYLRSRGVDEVTARALLVQAFLQEALDLISQDAVREAFAARAMAWFRAGQEANQ
jgi:Fe-S cluster assembly protein SufD